MLRQVAGQVPNFLKPGTNVVRYHQVMHHKRKDVTSITGPGTFHHRTWHVSRTPARARRARQRPGVVCSVLLTTSLWSLR